MQNPARDWSGAIAYGSVQMSDARYGATGVSAIAVVICLVGFGVIAWLIGPTRDPPIDTASTNFLHGHVSPTRDALMVAVTGLGSSDVLAAAAALAAGPRLPPTGTESPGSDDGGSSGRDGALRQ